MPLPIRLLVLIAILVAVTASSASQDPQEVTRKAYEGVVVTRDLEFATYGERTLLLDLYRPTERGESVLPVVVVIRGGGWRQGDKEGYGPIAAALAKRGLAAVCIEYRASGEMTYPAAVHDVKAAVRWVRANAEEYHFDSDAIGAIGGSAGAHLAVFSSLTAGDPALEGDGGNAEHSSAIAAAVGMSTPADFVAFGESGGRESVEEFLGVPYEEDATLWSQASPAECVDESSPPLLLIHSSVDRVVPFQHAITLTGRYGEAGRPAELVLISGARHAFWQQDSWLEQTMDRAADFFARNLGAAD